MFNFILGGLIASYLVSVYYTNNQNIAATLETLQRDGKIWFQKMREFCESRK